MDTFIQELVQKMTLHEKAALCSGEDFWSLKKNRRLGIPSIAVADGPHGLRKQRGESDHLGVNMSEPATCFPTASATASSWNRSLLYEIGIAIAAECLQEDVQILLGPGINIKRSPLCGRNFEYFSEDPYLSGELATGFIAGVQSMGVGTSLKHLAANNQEYRRMTTDSVVDERTLREIYLSAFERAIKNAHPWTVMSAYNMLDGVYCSENHRLLTQILREEWLFKGIVISDWGAVDNRVAALKAGLDLEMPGCKGLTDRMIVKAVRSGQLDEKLLDQTAERLLETIFKVHQLRRPGFVYDQFAHHQLAKRAALESAVLLKNEGALLPLNRQEPILFVGEFFENPRYQGSGSSMINPHQLVSAKKRCEQLGLPFYYRRGYNVRTDKPDSQLLEDAVSAAKNVGKVVIFAGLTADYESEGFDRSHLHLPHAHNALIEQILAVNANVIVVLQNGAPVLMPWLSRVKSVFEAYLGGEAGGEAIIDLLYGIEVPSAKLAETFPESLESCAASANFANNPHTVEYREGLYVGYRDYDSFKKKVLFPFGHGLSYTVFSYEHIRLSHSSIHCDERLAVTVEVRNVGKVAGAEIVQLYVHDNDSTIFRPEQELKGFEKVWLEPDEMKIVRFVLDKRAFAYYHIEEKDWHVESGRFEIRVGRSSRDIQLNAFVRVDTRKHSIPVPDLRQIAPEYYQKAKRGLKVSEESFKKVLTRELPKKKVIKRGEFSLNSTLGDVRISRLGFWIYQYAMNQFTKVALEHGHDQALIDRLKSAFEDMPLRSFILVTNGQLSQRQLETVLHLMNGHYFKALKTLIKKR